MDLSSDNNLMLEVRSGDIDKLGPLFERYKSALFAYFYRITGCVQISEDLVQSVFLRILKYRSRFAGDGKFTTWMYHIAHNVYKDHFRKNSIQQRVVDLDGSTPACGHTAESRQMAYERLHLLERALEQLSQDQREILVLSKYQGLKYQEIGQILGCSVGAVKVRIFRAIQRLRQVYVLLAGDLS